ncbi:metalloregulator ArsR/SmtB family transcription factor [Ktedonosporobacter rubrisoli]|uniref:Metalloregulator ArsR/SmtB family transcription factor n=1 Tax=Ktedonosporobacter rubrisoli TaxID=2509675 RepID=A0A4P6JWE3_KTERU|nr:metalloregulator ArsR/SmtB family transcription factor [Ktedonosporobacter rubrisoli]QBD79326.1 metalloregulator ArsR/SmtB family transcription factor [Ktedonosporobacter rubrisoli]
MSQEEFQTLLQFFKVLADENRLKLLGILANGEHSVEELAAFLHLRAPTISHHLARLKELKLVGMRSDGNTHYYWLNAEALRQTNRLLLTPEKMAVLANDIEGDAWERKVLRDFLDGIQLKEIPASRKKRAVILKWLASQFEYDVLYKEAQVNEIIQRHHIDASSLRREMVTAEKLLHREAGIYWRIPHGENWRSVSFASGGLTLQCSLGLPEGQGPFPTILEVHEGAKDSSADWLSPLSAFWLAHGFAYLAIKTGNADHSDPDAAWFWRMAGNPGHWELEDLLLVRRWLLEQGFAHPQKIVLTGWYYGASIALLALGKQPELWAGAMVGSAITDWWRNYQEAGNQDFIRKLFGAPPAEKPEQYMLSSPLIYAENVAAPILLLQDRHDPRCSVSEIEAYQQRLGTAGKQLSLHWLEHGAQALDVERMLEQRELMLKFANDACALS